MRIFGLLLLTFVTIVSVLSQTPSKVLPFKIESRKIPLSKDQSILVESIPLSFSIGAGITMRARPDLSTSELIVGITSKVEWGINCELLGVDKKQDCSYNFQSTRKINYLGYPYTVAELEVRYQLSKPKDPSQVIPFIKGVGLTEKGEASKDSFLLGEVGVLGLSPNSKFLQNIDSQRQSEDDTKVNFFLEYSIKNVEKWWDSTEENSGAGNLVFYPSKDSLKKQGDLVASLKVQNTSDYWEVQGAKVFVGENELDLGGKDTLCITNTRHYLFASRDTNRLRSFINKQVCGQDEDCPIDSIKQGAPFITIQIGTEQVTFSHHEYFYTTPNQPTFNQNIANLNEWEEGRSCSGAAGIAIGRQFFKNYTIHVEFNPSSNGTNILNIYKNKVPRTLANEERNIFIIIAAISAGFVLIIMIIKQVFIFKKLSAKPLTAEDIEKERATEELNLSNESFYNDVSAKSAIMVPKIIY